MHNALTESLSRLANRQPLAREEAARAFQIIMNGGATPAQIGAFLMALRITGETVDEITAGAEVLRLKAARFQAPALTLDTCGTGGDARGTYNISTAVAIVVAGCGVSVAKHGNRAVSSSSGSADVLQELGVKIDAPTAVMERALAEANFCFLLAPLYHTAMRHVAPVRQELGLRTIFNVLGPLSNPAKPTHQLLGVYAPDLVEPLARVLQALGTTRALVVHGHGGLDELSLSGPSQVVELKNGELNRYEIAPEDAGLPLAPIDSLQGGSPRKNAEALRNLLAGEKTPYRDAVLLNSAACLYLADKAQNLREAATLAAHAIDEGHAFSALRKLIDISNMPPRP